jgi:uncharacterized coiled-coil protein SlyX
VEVELLTLVTGPLGALGLSVGLIVWMGKVLLPVLRNYLEKQSAHLGELIDALNKTVGAHEADRVLFADSLMRLSVRVEKVETTLDSIAKKIL